MKLLASYKVYLTEKRCKKEFKIQREQEGVVCRNCKNTTHYWKKKQWECKKCGYCTTLKIGTVMHNSKLSFQCWFMAMTLISSTKNLSELRKFKDKLGIIVTNQFGK